MSIGQQPINLFLENLSAARPTPGGGAAAALLGATGVALGAMVVRYARQSPRYAAFAGKHIAALAALDDARVSFIQLADEDMDAYAAMNDALAMPKDAPARAVMLAEAATSAIGVPLRAMETTATIAELFESLRDSTSPRLASDLAIAVHACRAAAMAFAALVDANIPFLADPGSAASARATADACLRRVLAATPASGR